MSGTRAVRPETDRFRAGAGATAPGGPGTPSRPGAAPSCSPPSDQAWFQATEKFSPPLSAEVVALVVLPEAMVIWSGE